MSKKYGYWDTEKDEQVYTENLAKAVQETINQGEGDFCFISEVDQSEISSHLSTGKELDLDVSYCQQTNDYTGTYRVTYRPR
jgi:hypothetical protein